MSKREIIAFLLFLALSISLSSAESGVSSVTAAANQLCADLQSLLPIVAMIMIVLAAIIYGIGQTQGAETRARAITWATAALAGAIVAGLIYAVAPPVMSAIYGSNNFTCQGAIGGATGHAMTCPVCQACTVCNGATGVCEPKACAANQVCDSGTGGCKCKSGVTDCGNNICCASPKSECGAGGCECPSGETECGSLCCASGLNCFNSQCVIPSQDGESCNTQTQPCATGLSCCTPNGGAAGECINGGEACLNGIVCGSGEILCGPTNICSLPDECCADGTHCPQPGECISGSCQQPIICDGDICEFGEVCVHFTFDQSYGTHCSERCGSVWCPQRTTGLFISKPECIVNTGGVALCCDSVSPPNGCINADYYCVGNEIQ